MFNLSLAVIRKQRCGCWCVNRARALSHWENWGWESLIGSAVNGTCMVKEIRPQHGILLPPAVESVT